MTWSWTRTRRSLCQITFKSSARRVARFLPRSTIGGTDASLPLRSRQYIAKHLCDTMRWFFVTRCVKCSSKDFRSCYRAWRQLTGRRESSFEVGQEKLNTYTYWWYNVSKKVHATLVSVLYVESYIIRWEGEGEERNRKKVVCICLCCVLVDSFLSIVCSIDVIFWSCHILDSRVLI